MSRKFYIADTHIGHKNIIVHERDSISDYPFATAEERDAAIIANWKKRVAPKDEVFILGDIAFATKESAIELLSGLPGRKTIVMGNHDKQWFREFSGIPQTGVMKVCDYLEIKDEGRSVILSHYPILFWQKQHRDSWHVYGHVHMSQEEEMFQEAGRRLVDCGWFDEFRAVNAGAVAVGFMPVTLDEMIMAKYEREADMLYLEQEAQEDRRQGW